MSLIKPDAAERAERRAERDAERRLYARAAIAYVALCSGLITRAEYARAAAASEAAIARGHEHAEAVRAARAHADAVAAARCRPGRDAERRNLRLAWTSTAEAAA